MVVSEWVDEKKYGNDLVLGRVEIKDDIAKISLNEKNYSMASISFTITDLPKEKRYITIDFKTETDGIATIKYLAAWFTGQTEIYKGYINSGEKIIMRDNADSIVVTALIMSRKGGNVKIPLPKVTAGEIVKPRRAKLAAVSIPYVFLKDTLKRDLIPSDILEASLNRIDALVRIDNPDLIVLTECFLTRNVVYPFIESFVTEDGPEITKMRQKAKEHKVYLSFSVREKDKDGFFYNTAFLIDRDGNISAKYRKSHFTMDELLEAYVPGDECPVVETDFGKVGFAICWDLFFNDYVKLLAKKGAEIIINPTAGFHLDMNSMRAQDNGVYIVSAGTDGEKTAIIGPDGQLLSMNIRRGCAVSEIDLNEVFPVHYLSSNSWSIRKDVYVNEARNDLYEKEN